MSWFTLTPTLLLRDAAPRDGSRSRREREKVS
jgi:hypothetical protein